MKQRTERRYVLLIALILLHLAGFSQEKNYVKKNLRFPVDSSKSTQTPPSPSLGKYPFWKVPLLESPGKNMGFFCRQEYKMEKIARVPVKIRLGTYQEAQRLEYGVKTW